MRNDAADAMSWTRRHCRQAIAGAVLVAVALVHVIRIGARIQGRALVIYYSYFSDIAVPFGAYFLLCLSDTRVRAARDWRVKMLTVFAVASAMEVAQALGAPVLGQTVDPFDFVMFGVGVALAAVVDVGVLERGVRCWSSVVATTTGGRAET